VAAGLVRAGAIACGLAALLFACAAWAAPAAIAWPLAGGRPAAGEREALAAAYAAAPARRYWLDGAGAPTPQARAALDLLRRAADEGLDPDDYAPGILAAQAARLVASAQDASAPGARDAFDRTLSAALLRYALHLRYGRIGARQAGFDLRAPRAEFDAPGWLVALATAPDVGAAARAAAPPFLHYRLLQQALGRYRELAAARSWPQFPALPRRSVRTGEHYAGAPLLREALVALGDLPPADAGAGGDVLDAPLCAALARFQARHGLDADGTLGRRTLAALQVTPAERVRQIVLTLERWRWLPPFRVPQIVVNIPQFRLFAFDGTEDRVAGTLQMPVITGRAYKKTRTPVFTADIEVVVFRPYWDVPRSILVNEILPLVQSKPGYLERNRFELVRGPGDDSPVVAPTPDNLAALALARGALRLRQRPGADNTLGLIKFVLPNDYGVYLHGTPGQRNFLLSRRDLSHGCIRVSDPAALAAYALRNEPGAWTPEAIEAATRGEDARRVRLTRPVHVMLLYGTALAAEDGRMLFFDDIYGLDRRLAELLRRAAVTDSEGASARALRAGR